MDARLQSLLDKQEITELIHTYCSASDRHDHAALRALYHDDAIDDHGTFFKGLASVFIDKLPEIQAPMKILHHNITTVNIALDGNHGEGEVYVLAFHQVDTDDQPFDLLVGGRYLDKYEKRGGRWKFSYRAIVADWATCSNPSTVCLEHPMLAGSPVGQPDLQDPSYDFFHLLRRRLPAN